MHTRMIAWKRIRLFWLVAALTFLTACQPSAARNAVEITVFPSPTASQGEPSRTLPPPTATITPSPIPTETPQPTATPQPSPTPLPNFRFAVNGDPAYHAGEGEMDTPQFFRGMAEHMAEQDNLDFLVTVGDTDPPWDARWTIDRYLGEDFLWYPVVGNHELYESSMAWLREYNYDPNGSAPPNIVNPGPPGCEQTTFSFDNLNTHFVVLNVYCDLDNEMRTDGAIVDHLYNWLTEDLAATDKEHIFVFGHEPAFPQPDADAGISRHVGDSLDQYPITRDGFWALLKEHNVVAYITGHTHSYSIVDIDGVWQVDIAHSMGARTQATRSTYVIIEVNGSRVNYITYRVNNYTDEYELAHSGQLR